MQVIGKREDFFENKELRSDCNYHNKDNLAIVEPVFANIRSQKRFGRFTLRTKEKVNIQWMLFALVTQY